MNKILVLALLLLLSAPVVNGGYSANEPLEEVNYFGEILSMNMPNWVAYVDWSPDGNKIVSSDWKKNIQIWNSSDGELLNNLVGHTQPVWTVKWSPDGTKIASASWDYSVRIWNAGTGDELDMYNHNSQVYGLDWSPDGTQILTGNDNGELILWDVSTGNPVLSLTNHTYPVPAVEWSPDGTMVATGDWDNKLIIWNASTYEIKDSYNHLLERGDGCCIEDISWSPDSNKIAVGGSEGNLTLIDFLNDSRIDVTVFKNDYSQSTDGIWGISWSPDGNKIATSMQEGYVLIWNVNGKKIRTLTGHLPGTDSYSEAVRWSPDGKKLANGANDNIVRIWGDLRDVISEQNETIQGQQNVILGQNETIQEQQNVISEQNETIQEQENTLNNISSDITRFEQDMQTTFNNPDFTLNGSTPDEKANTLVEVLIQLSRGAKNEIYKLLGYK